ncbi:hypothetical protein Cgig2_017385 [Carnegiea gigantea]|uniref:Uncharacterized protein n=1 Tax=Carnegiea gigantea TaxID=171969 RepID=A0A9Q1GQW8_9CARY|nr:hypothetical protein Cgig2_017385 [Carnegiea gigantea]
MELYLSTRCVSALLVSRLRCRSHLTAPGALHRSGAGAGADREAILGSVVAGQLLRESDTVCFKRGIKPVRRVERTSSMPSKQREEPHIKMLTSPYKEALLSYPNSNMLEAPNGNLEVVGNDVYKGLSDNSQTITQPLDDAHNHLIFVGKFPSQTPSCGSSMEDDKETNSSLRPFDSALKMDIQHHEKREMTKHSNNDKNSGNRNLRSIHDSSIPTEIGKEALDVGKRLGISIVGDENPIIRRIIRSLRKKIENKEQVCYS